MAATPAVGQITECTVLTEALRDGVTSRLTGTEASEGHMFTVTPHPYWQAVLG